MADGQPDPAVVQPSPPGWLPDPYNRHEFRFFDGTNWQRDVLDDGVQAIDNLGPSGYYLDPIGHHELRHWSEKWGQWESFVIDDDQHGHDHLSVSLLPPSPGTQPVRTDKPETSFHLVGWLAFLLAVIMVFLALYSVRQYINDNFAPNSTWDSYSQENYELCKSLLYGSDFPEERVTDLQRRRIVTCAVNLSR